MTYVELMSRLRLLYRTAGISEILITTQYLLLNENVLNVNETKM